MSVLRQSEWLYPSDFQIRNNTTFDNCDSEELPRASWSHLKSPSVKTSDSYEPVSRKENRSPLFENYSVFAESPRHGSKLLQSTTALENLVISRKANTKLGSLEDVISKNGAEGEIRDERKIDKEIEEVEMEISRLSSRLEALRMGKAEKCVQTVEKRGRVMGPKLVQKISGKDAEESKKIDESLPTNAKMKIYRGGLSLVPSEIVLGARRGLSMGPSEILSGAKLRQLGKQDIITPVQLKQNRRKSCFWNLQEIDEESMSKERGKSLSPKSRKTTEKNQASRKAVTTIASKRIVKKDDGVLNSIQPKKLFRDVESSVPAANRRPQRPGRVVASRYNKISVQSSAVRKRSLPENDKDESEGCDKKRSLSTGKSQVTRSEKKNTGTEIRVKTKWEIPNGIVVHKGTESEKSQPSISVMPDLFPRIRIARCMKESPRDSGPAKRVAELIGKKSIFSNDDEDPEPSACQALSFAEDDV